MNDKRGRPHEGPPGLENINDVSKYEFFAGHTDTGGPMWTSTFSEIEPIVDWNNNAGNARRR